jgi:[ribosomal protein S5]-alanine N-acetyltransferase
VRVAPVKHELRPEAGVRRDRVIHLVPINADGNAPGVLPAAAAEVLTSMAAVYQRTGFEPPWTGYLAFDGAECVGTCAFKSPPRENRVEIAYFTFPGHEGKAVATRMARALIQIATSTLPGITVTAQTLPETNASTRILQNLGFKNVGEVQHPEDGRVWEWSLHPTAKPSG